VWVFGSTDPDDCETGMGAVIESANQGGEPRWVAPPNASWDYTAFAAIRRSLR